MTGWLIGGAIYGLIAYNQKWFPFGGFGIGTTGATALTPAQRAQSQARAPGVAQHLQVAMNQVINTLRAKGVPYSKIEPGMTDGSGGIKRGQPAIIIHTTQAARADAALPPFLKTATGGKVYIEIEPLG